MKIKSSGSYHQRPYLVMNKIVSFISTSQNRGGGMDGEILFSEKQLVKYL